MTRQGSPLLIVFGVCNIIVSLLPVCGGCGGSSFFFQNPDVVVNNRQLGPQFKRHLDADVPLAKYEAFVSWLLNMFFSCLLIAGAVGLFMSQNWARWLSIATALLFILTLCAHDIFQIGLVQPSVSRFFDQQIPPGPFRDGFKFGFQAVFFAWTWFSPVIMLYLLIMSVCVGISTALGQEQEKSERRRRPRYDDDDEDDDSRF